MAKRKNGVQSLLGFERFTRYGVKTDKSEVVLFAVEPTNISVMSKANVEIKVHSLMMVLSVLPDLQIIAIDSAERFDSNKAYMFKRLESEQNEAVRKLLISDISMRMVVNKIVVHQNEDKTLDIKFELNGKLGDNKKVEISE